MDDRELLYQTYLVTFTTMRLAIGSRVPRRIASLRNEVASRDGIAQHVSEMALVDAEDNALRSRTELIEALVARIRSLSAMESSPCEA